MNHAVKLTKLPEGFQLPDDFAQRFKFDAERHRLAYSGFMCKYEFDRLFQLHNDREYREALEELFVLCSGADKPRGRRWPAVLMGTSVMLAAAATWFWLSHR